MTKHLRIGRECNSLKVSVLETLYPLQSQALKHISDPAVRLVPCLALRRRSNEAYSPVTQKSPISAQPRRRTYLNRRISRRFYGGGSTHARMVRSFRIARKLLISFAFTTGVGGQSALFCTVHDVQVPQTSPQACIAEPRQLCSIAAGFSSLIGWGTESCLI